MKKLDSWKGVVHDISIIICAEVEARIQGLSDPINSGDNNSEGSDL